MFSVFSQLSREIHGGFTRPGTVYFSLVNSILSPSVAHNPGNVLSYFFISGCWLMFYLLSIHNKLMKLWASMCCYSSILNFFYILRNIIYIARGLKREESISTEVKNHWYKCTVPKYIPDAPKGKVYTQNNLFYNTLEHYHFKSKSIFFASSRRNKRINKWSNRGSCERLRNVTEHCFWTFGRWIKFILILRTAHGIIFFSIILLSSFLHYTARDFSSFIRHPDPEVTRT